MAARGVAGLGEGMGCERVLYGSIYYRRREGCIGYLGASGEVSVEVGHGCALRLTVMVCKIVSDHTCSSSWLDVRPALSSIIGSIVVVNVPVATSVLVVK